MRPPLLAAARATLAATAALAVPAAGTAQHPVMGEVDVEVRPGTRLPLDARFRDADGGHVPLGSLFAGERPVLLVPGWYRCRMLCGRVLDGVADVVSALEERGLRAGRDFTVVALSIDPREGPADARERRDRIRARLNRGQGGPEGALDGWRFLSDVTDTGAEPAADTPSGGHDASPDLTGSPAARVADSLGFRYAWDPSTEQYAHAAAVFAVSPTGTVTGALYGVSFDPGRVETAVDRAAAESPGPSLEKVLMRCFRYTPALERHAGLIANLLRGGGALIVLGLAGVFILAGRRAVREGSA